MTIPGIFSIVVGTGMIGQWSVSYAAKQIPELTTEPYRIWFHIAGEIATALMLIISGCAAPRATRASARRSTRRPSRSPACSWRGRA